MAGSGLEVAGVVETSLAKALTLAAEGGRWELVAQLGHELEARRVAREGSGGGGVVELATADAKVDKARGNGVA